MNGENQRKEKRGNYMLEGMCVGLALAIGIYGSEPLTNGIGFVVGLIVGFFIKKPEKKGR